MIGAILGGLGLVSSLAGSIIGGSSARKQQRKQELDQAVNAKLASAANLTNAFNQNNDDINKRISFRCGGKVKRKMANGGNAKLGAMDYISGIGNIAGNVIDIINASNTRTSNTYNAFAPIAKKEVQDDDTYNVPTDMNTPLWRLNKFGLRGLSSLYGRSEPR